MRFSFISLALFSVYFAYVSALPRPPTQALPARRLVISKGVPKTLHPPIRKGRAPRPTSNGAARSQKGSPSKAARKKLENNKTNTLQGAACARRPADKRPRDIEFEYFDRRAPMDEKELNYNIANTKIDGGSYGDIYSVIGHDNLLAKTVKPKPIQGLSTDLKTFKAEAEALSRVGQLEDWGYKTNTECNKVYYIIMKKVPGVTFVKTAAYHAVKNDRAKLKALVEQKLIPLVTEKVHHYIKTDGVLHGNRDLNASNLMCVEKDGQIEAVDLVDWGTASIVAKNNNLLTLDYVRNKCVTPFLEDFLIEPSS
ncbi:hypothetical protein GALMADRAFT_1359386 [Galerina marginata CBS 339.88]|uniref:Protein kinase domain-containing protein n=1 Tax=Galerina marginata (strain CBS 339.88) TaxID=685588 RepID=A0A067SA51_GALM3|nr:hypothetical protein GALMADRAFT_1359386 [Galerina marginata CBS 339.88]